ncbi:hypothetical protein BH23ACI1_BH23ACI1_15160 [soil metagenome]|nr:DinB family protein [Acidobacteriota bacterium]
MTTRFFTSLGLTVVLAGSGMAAFETQQPNPITASTKSFNDTVRGFVTRAAEQFPEDLYGFQPTPEVRTFGQLLGHIANANYMICGTATGEKGPGVDIEKTATTKAALVKALDESFAFCDRAFESMTDTRGAEMVKFFAGEQARLGVLGFNTAHNYEHYGNIVTYMRLKGMVPPSSAGR